MLSNRLQHNTRSAGFSLVELVVVVMVLGVIAAIAAPRFGHAASSHRVDAAQKKIQLDLEYASQVARARSEAVVIEFDLDTDSYTLVGIKDPLNPGRDYTVFLNEAPYSSRITDVRFSGTSVTSLTLNGHGVVDTEGVIRIESGLNARLIGFGATQTIPFTQGIMTVPVESKEKKPNLDEIIPGGFPKGI